MLQRRCMHGCAALIGLNAARLPCAKTRTSVPARLPRITAGARTAEPPHREVLAGSVTLVFAWICSVPLLSYVQLRARVDIRCTYSRRHLRCEWRKFGICRLSSSLRDVHLLSQSAANRAFSSLPFHSSCPLLHQRHLIGMRISAGQSSPDGRMPGNSGIERLSLSLAYCWRNPAAAPKQLKPLRGVRSVTVGRMSFPARRATRIRISPRSSRGGSPL